MPRVRRVIGKQPDLIYELSEDRLPDGQYRTAAIEGTIRVVPGRLPHSGGFRSPFDHHGHLIADQLGGPGDAASGNIVPMHGHANSGSQGEYRGMERTVVQMLGDGDGWMRVDCRYRGAAEVRPHCFDVQVKYPNGMHSRWKIFNFYPHLPR